MQEIDKVVLIYSTFPAQEAAEATGGGLVDRGLAACVNIIPGMTAIYVWQGQRQRDTEIVMIVKTRASLAGIVMEEMRRTHPYQTPALVVLPVEGGSGPFLDWVMAQTSVPRLE